MIGYLIHKVFVHETILWITMQKQENRTSIRHLIRISTIVRKDAGTRRTFDISRFELFECRRSRHDGRSWFRGKIREMSARYITCFSTVGSF